MVKNIIIGVLLVLVLLLGVFAMTQRGYAEANALEAEMQRIAATEQAVLARKVQAEAEHERIMAEEARDQALMQQKLAEEALANCKGK